MDTELHHPAHHVTPYKKAESFYERNAVALQWGIIGAAFLAACGIYWWRTTAAVEAQALVQLALAQDIEDYAGIAAESSGTRAASWAKLREANGYLDSALRDAFSNREKANTDLEKAVNLLDSLRKNSRPAELQEQVLFAYARSLEMTSDGKLDPAIEAYEALLKKFPGTHFKREAQERIHALQQPSAQEFYAFFAKQNPKPAEAARPNDDKDGKKAGTTDNPLSPLTFGTGDQKAVPDAGPAFPLPPPLMDKKDVPEGPAIPEATKPDAAKEEAKPTDAKPADQPKSESEPAKPTEEKKATEVKPAVEKPAETEKPVPPAADEKKADAEKPAEEKKP